MHQALLGKSNQSEIVGHVECIDETRHAYTILIRHPEGNKSIRRYMRRRENNINTDNIK
jgi:hypothetical protein